MSTDFSKPESILSTVFSLLKAGGMIKAASLLKEADARFENTGFDNWNGGTDIYTLYLNIGSDDFAKLGGEKELIESQISEQLRSVIEPISDDFVSVQICPRLQNDSDWRSKKDYITQITIPRLFENPAPPPCQAGPSWTLPDR